MPLALTWFWFGGGFLYLMLLITLGVMTIRNGHILLFILGLFPPLLDHRSFDVSEAELLIGP